MTRTRCTLALASALSVASLGAVVAGCDSDRDPDAEPTLPAPEAGDAETDAKVDDASPAVDASDASEELVDASPEPIVCTATPCAVEIAAGANSACVRLNDGTVRCWGSNIAGELGRGPEAGNASSAPAPVVGLTDVVQLSGAASEPSDAYCALRAGGAVLCWGSNARGVLGRVSDGGVLTESSPTAAAVDGLGAAAAVFAGFSVSCAALAGNQIACWGSNATAQIPDRPPAATPLLPVTSFALPASATAIAIADRGTVALTDAGLVSWGVRGDPLGTKTGVLGREFSLDYAPPGSIALDRVSAVAASVGRACAIANGAVRCWGAGTNGGGDSVYPTPVGVGNPRAFAQTISVGPRTACATVSDGTARCWGDNSRGQLGTGDTALQPMPVTVAGLAGRPVRTATMKATTCAILSSGSVQCWGQNDRGQLGTGTADALAHLEPQNVVLTP